MKILRLCERKLKCLIVRDQSNFFSLKNSMPFIFIGYWVVGGIIYVLFEADHLQEYFEAFYPFITGLMNIICISGIVWKRIPLFKALDDFGNIIETRKWERNTELIEANKWNSDIGGAFHVVIFDSAKLLPRLIISVRQFQRKSLSVQNFQNIISYFRFDESNGEKSVWKSECYDWKMLGNLLFLCCESSNCTFSHPISPSELFPLFHHWLG